MDLFKRVISLVLLVIMLLSAVGCGGTGGDGATTTAGTAAAAAEKAETTELYYTADIPAGTDYKGYEFRILVNEVAHFVWGDVDFIAPEQNGEVINDAVYQRNRETEELLNVTLKAVESKNVQEDTNKAVLAGDDAYDLSMVHVHGAAALAGGGLIVELHQLPTLDFDSPWWDGNSISDLSINKKVFMMTGDIETMYRKSIGVIMFNKQIHADHQLDDPYKIMSDRKWTIDTMINMGVNVSADINGDGIYNESDKYGLIYFSDMMALALIGCGVEFATKDADDIPQLSFYGEKTNLVIEKLAELLYVPELSWSWSKAGKTEEAAFKMYQNDQSLFYYGELHAVATMRGMETDFGIMPMPLFNETQESYHHCINPHVAPVVAVPMTVSDFEREGIVLEVMGASSKNLLTPAYYEITLKGKVSRDEESSATLDIVLSTIRYDIGYLFNWGLAALPLGMANSYSTDLASKYESVEASVLAKMQETIEAFTD